MAKTRSPAVTRRAAQSTVTKLVWRENRISEHREAKDGMTQQDMSDALLEKGIDLSRNSVSRIEQGKQRPPASTLLAMAEVLGTDVNSMLDLSPEEAKQIGEFRSLGLKGQQRVLRIARAAHDDDR